MSLPRIFHFYRHAAYPPIPRSLNGLLRVAAARLTAPQASMAEMAVEETGDLSERLLGLGHPIIELVLRVRPIIRHATMSRLPP